MNINTSPFHCLCKPEDYACKRCKFTTRLKILFINHWQYCPEEVIFVDKLEEFECQCGMKTYSQLLHRVHIRKCVHYQPLKVVEPKSELNCNIEAKSELNSTGNVSGSSFMIDFADYVEEEENEYETTDEDERDLKCEYCFFLASDKSDFEKHIYENHECPKCTFTTSAIIEFKEHLKEHECGKIEVNAVAGFYFCPHCDYKTKRKCNIDKHFRTSHLNIPAELVTCLHCPFQSSITSVKDHVRRKHPNNPRSRSRKLGIVKCDHCDYTARENSRLQRHVLYRHTNHNDIDWKYCEMCSYRGKTTHALRMHTKIMHENPKWFGCKSCDYKSKNSTQLKIHVFCKHSNIVFAEANQVGDDFKCVSCDHRTRWKASLKRHYILVHMVDTHVEID